MKYLLCIEWGSVAAWVSPIVSGLLTFLISILVIQKNKKIAEEQKLAETLRNLVNKGIDYPELEDKEFIQKWCDNKLESKDRVRYEMYCINWFNYLEDLCKFYSFDKNIIEKKLHIKEIVRNHKAWWSSPDDEYANVDGYDKKFREFINSNCLK